MKIDLFKRVALKIDIPDQRLRKGDIATSRCQIVCKKI
jgi:hypothetical protein